MSASLFPPLLLKVLSLPTNSACRLPAETHDLPLASRFKLYSYKKCIVDCSFRLAEASCGCRPWDVPPQRINLGEVKDKGVKGVGSSVSCWFPFLEGEGSFRCESLVRAFYTLQAIAFPKDKNNGRGKGSWAHGCICV